MDEEKESNINIADIPKVFTLDQCPKKPDNPLFAEEKKKEQQYVDSLQAQVDFLRMKDPLKYQKYQSIGNSLMECTYNLKPGIDEEGDKITAQKLLHTIRDYGLEFENDLSLDERHLLLRVYGVKWCDKLLELE